MSAKIIYEGKTAKPLFVWGTSCFTEFQYNEVGEKTKQIQSEGLTTHYYTDEDGGLQVEKEVTSESLPMHEGCFVDYIKKHRKNNLNLLISNKRYKIDFEDYLYGFKIGKLTENFLMVTENDLKKLFKEIPEAAFEGVSVWLKRENLYQDSDATKIIEFFKERGELFTFFDPSRADFLTL